MSAIALVRRTLLVMAALLALPAAAQVQGGLPPAPQWIAPSGISADARAASVELLAAMEASRQMRTQVQARLAAAQKALRTQLPKLPALRALREADPEGYRRELAKAEAALASGGADMFRAMEPKLMAELADLYARRFTVEELRGLTAFYGSPLGQRYRDMLPTLNREGAVIARRLARDHLPLILGRLASEIDDHAEAADQEL